ncbi:hypothetical protein JCM10212_004137 [Sporobolomyces blumeae]
MPKAPTTPLSCLFAINKPTGQVSMTLLNKLQPLFSNSALFKDPNAKQEEPKGKGKGRRAKWKQDRIKMGQGGTLDPLADGVLVIGTNAATKQLAGFLDCTKTYRAIGLVGCSTDSYDSDGKIVHEAKTWDQVTEEAVRDKLEMFRGEIEQTPPVYSALKMDGKPLYEYARSGLALPRPIPARKVTISDISLVSFTPGADRTDSYEFPKERLGDKEKLEMERLQKMVKEGRTEVPSEEEVVKEDEQKNEDNAAKETNGTSDLAATRPPIFEISLTVSSGTYIRSVVHDLGVALGTHCHVVKLTRTRQGGFSLAPNATTSTSKAASGSEQADAVASVAGGAGEEQAAKAEEPEPLERGCVEWSLLEKAIAKMDEAKKGGQSAKDALDAERDADGWLEWEREVLRNCKTV